jgi:very-short-patch-repair endonuclease
VQPGQPGPPFAEMARFAVDGTKSGAIDRGFCHFDREGAERWTEDEVLVHTFMMSHDVLTRKALKATGLSDWQVHQFLHTGSLAQASFGRWIEVSSDDDENWRRKLRANLDRCEAQAIASHRSAARLHKLDGSWGDAIHAHVSTNGVRRQAGFFRSQPLPDNEIVTTDGIRCTSLVRTLVDLGRVADADAVEIALESALRGDPKTPNVWKVHLLRTLTEYATTPRVLGHATLRLVLRRRPFNARPTGSGAETILFLAFRRHGIDVHVERQPTVTVINLVTGVRITIYPDLFFPGLGLVIEVDGVGEHSGYDRRLRDDARENKLSGGLRVIRYTGQDIWKRADEIAREVAAEIKLEQRRGLRSDVKWEHLGEWRHRYTIGKD